MRSLSEIDTLSKRASKGIGFSWGISEEIGKSIKLMDMFGLPGLKNLNKYFKVIKKSQFQNISLITETNISNKIPYCPLITGINFMDQIHSLEKYGFLRSSGSKLGAKIDEKSKFFAEFLPERFQDAPRRAQDVPKMPKTLHKMSSKLSPDAFKIPRSRETSAAHERAKQASERSDLGCSQGGPRYFKIPKMLSS